MTTSNKSSSFPRVVSVKAYTVSAPEQDRQQPMSGGGADCHDVDDEHWINGSPTPIANPMSGYVQYAASRKSWGINALGSLVVELTADDGSTGIGVTIAGQPGCYIAEYHLSRFVEGEDPRNVELIWDQMYRSTLNYGRKGLTLQVISAIDLALWDLLGNIRQEPVWALLGGKTKDRLPAYCTTARPDLAKKAGFAGAKIPCPYGPADGDRGMRQNVEFFSNWRQQVGPEFPLMLDCYMSLTRPYATRLARQLAPHGLKWIEECLQPDDYTGYAELSQALRHDSAACGGVMVSTGEHEYTRYGFRQLVDHVDILQPDVTWMGGLTEARRVVAMAAASDRIVIPHGSSVYSYHLQYAFTNCPVAEYINLSPKADEIVPYFGDLFIGEPLPKDGFVDLPEDKSGFGITINRSKLKRPYVRSEEESRVQADRNMNKKRTSVPLLPF